jgi:DNA-binding PadR family transcriptional regulator
LGCNDLRALAVIGKMGRPTREEAALPYYQLRSLQADGLVRGMTRDDGYRYELTQKGREALAEGEKERAWRQEHARGESPR